MSDSNFLSPKLVTLRKLENYEKELKIASEYYRTSVASTIFVKAMKDAPRLAKELDELNSRYRNLLNKYSNLKSTISCYFESQEKIKELIK